ncbi:hypothetical protein [Tumebacillus flagellatus]|uniref:Uncharacterized protein n=1 Tax=Tumebacillus flagellatus TaxID=1157490 RepID=A0A074LJF1_9BACL|nr:hypothetical protein [Tumebacillus flagellatus]KEO82306.1 hypothetical protein EL26_16105 [Tumebacillus flagellatus]
MWEKQLQWLSAATPWDWFWHIVAAVLCVYFSVPQLCWPMISRVIKWYKKRKGIVDQPSTSESSVVDRP